MSHAGTPRILIARTDRIGDLVLSTPAIRAVRAAHPTGYVAALVQPATRALVDGHPALDEVLVLEKHGAHRGWRGFWRLARALRDRRFDQALILHTTNRVVLAAWLAGIPVRIGYARRLGWLLTHPVPYTKRFGTKHELDYTLDLVRAAGIPAEDRTLEIAWQPEGRAQVEQWLETVRASTSSARTEATPVRPELATPVRPELATPVRPELATPVRPELVEGRMPLIVLHPGASCPSKRWPAARFAAIADQLAGSGGAFRFVAIAGPGDDALVREVQRLAHVPVAVPPAPFTLAELPWLLRRAQCLVSNDSGPVHVAGAAGTPVVAIFGRWGGGLSPTRWGPTGPRSAVLHHDVGCRPCLAHRCRIGFKCLDAVTVDEVVAAVRTLIGA